MSDISYAPLIEDMTWSYSRIKAFEDCPYRWFLKYIRYPGVRGDDMFFSGYGKFVHDLLAGFYRGEASALQTQLLYLDNFKDSVLGRAPSPTVFQNYFLDGVNYISSLTTPPGNIIGVEQKVEFSIDGYPFVGFVDYVTKNEHLGIGDHKSRNLKARSGRKKPTKGDQELDSYLRQLYLYSVPISKQYGMYPNTLEFNCFRQQLLIQEPFDEEAFEEAKEWAVDRIESIAATSEFDPSPEFFKCRYLCEMHYLCPHFPT